MLESLAEWMGYPLYYTMDGAAPPPRSGAAPNSAARAHPAASADVSGKAPPRSDAQGRLL